MSDNQQAYRSRRRVLCGLGATVAASVFGTTAAAATARPSQDGTADGDDDLNGETDAGSRYADIYADIIDDVVLVTVGGPDEDGPDGMGSGFVLEDDYVVTNNHVVGDTTEVELQFRDEQWTTAEVIGTDAHSDIAVLDPEDVPDAVDGLSFVEETPTVGQEVLALGNPLGFDASVTQGIVSGVDRSLPSPTGFSIPAAIQTDASLNPGNSGGPLVTLEGDVVGIVFAGASQTIGFAISAQLADRVIPELIETGEYTHPYMGVGVLPVDPVLADANDLEEPRGVIVTEIVPGGPADGVLEAADGGTVTGDTVIPTGGDVIVAIEDEQIPNQDALSAALALETSPGDSIDLEVIRDGERETVELELEERPAVDGP